MKKNVWIFLIILIIVAFVASVFFYLGKEKKDLNFPNSKNFSDIPINEICLKISQPDDLYYCLAVANKDAEYCQNLDMPNQKKLCQGMAVRDVSYCREIQEAEPREMCFCELATITKNINYCDEAKDKERCYFNFITDFYWAGQAEKIKTEYCNKFPSQSPERDTCFALKDKDISLCEGSNPACLTFFEQDLSFCENVKAEDKIKCIRDRAIIAENPMICEKATDPEVKDECYLGYVSHFNPDISLCEKIKNEQLKNTCYMEGAIILSEGVLVKEEIEKGVENPETEKQLSREQQLIPSSYHIKNSPYYREDGFCWGASAIMLMMDYGLPENEVQNIRAVLKSGPGGTPDMFMGFHAFGVIDKVRIAYSKNYIKKFADFYNRQILVKPEEQTILFDNQIAALNYLKKLISLDILVIADVHYGNHFVVVTGYDENYIYINDPGYDNGYEYKEGAYREQVKLSINQFLKEWGISGQEKTLAEKEGAIGFPGDYGMIWLEK